MQLLVKFPPRGYEQRCSLHFCVDMNWQCYGQHALWINFRIVFLGYENLSKILIFVVPELKESIFKKKTVCLMNDLLSLNISLQTVVLGSGYGFIFVVPNLKWNRQNFFFLIKSGFPWTKQFQIHVIVTNVCWLIFCIVFDDFK